MKIEYVVVETGEVLDVVIVPETGPIEYRTGVAADQVRTIERIAGGRPGLIDALRGWTNGYTHLREVKG